MFPAVRTPKLPVLAAYLLVTCGLIAVEAATDGREAKSAYACEDDQLVLECQAGEVIRIQRANYGRFTISLCNRHGETEGWSLQCMSTKAKDIISERCDGRRQCDMRVSNHVFGDPCPLTSKYAEVKYICHLAPVDITHNATTVATMAPNPPPMPLNGVPPQITSVTAHSPDTIEITWIQLRSPVPIRTTVLYLEETAVNEKPLVFYPNSSGSYIIENLKPNTVYSIYLKNFNFFGPSVTSNRVNVRTPPLACPESSALPPVTTLTTTLKPSSAAYISENTTHLLPLVAAVQNNPPDSGTFKGKLFSTLRKVFTSMFASSNDSSANTNHAADSTKSSTGTAKDDSHLRPTTSRIGTVRPSFTDFWNKNSFDDTDSVVSTLPSTTWPATLRPDLRLSTGHTSPKDPQAGYNESVSGVVDKFCDERVHMDVLWLKTRFGRRATAACPGNLIGAATWRCLSYGWEEPGPDLSDCTSPWMESVDSLVQKVITGEEQPEEAATALTEAMRDQELTVGDVKRASMNLLPRLAQGFQQSNSFELKPIRLQRIRKFTEKFVSASSILLSEKNSRSWQSLTIQEQRQAATTMLLAVEDTGFHAASLMDVGTSEVTVDENLVMEISVLDPVQVHNDITFPSKNDLSGTLWRADTDSITISSSSLKNVGTRGPINIVFTLYKNMEDLIQPMVNTIPTIPSSAYMGDNDNYYSTGTIRDSNMVEEPAVSTRRLVNSKIIAASINSTKQRRPLAGPVRFTLHHLEKSTSDAKMHCAFWDIDSSHLGGRWSQDGCHLLDTNATHTTCQCDHLTNFAVLMDVTGVKLSQTNVLALRVITFVGCTISVVCLMLSWITFLVFKNLQCDRNTIHKNLVFCLLLAEIVFLAGIAQTEPKILCSIIACILHYLFLGSFAWMCLEGIQLYVMLVEVFEQEKSRVHWYYLFGYGVPALIVSISAGVYYQGYGTARHCWLTTERYFIWSFVGPVLAVMLINIGMLSIAVYIMCRHSNMSATMRDRSKGTKFSVTESLSSMETFAPPKLRFPELPAWVKGAIVLVVLLGLTWLLGVLYLNEESVIMAYAFTVLNSLQGLFIFIFHCLKNEKVQKEYRKVARRTSWLPNCIRVNYGGYTGVASSSPIGSSGSGNYLSRLFGQKRNRNSAISTNSSAKPFFSSDQHRGSDIVNSTSKESSNVPSSLNGYVYNPNYSASGNGSVKTPLLSGGAAKLSQGGQTYMGNNYEMVDDLAVDLSEYVDCSVVDSGYVSEYCKHNMQVSREVRRYSTGSEDSDSGKPVIPHNSLEVDNLSTLSLASSSRKPSSYVSSTETCHRHADDDLDKNLEGKLRKETLDPGLNFRQYIIPVSRKMNTSSNNNNIHIKNINETSSADKISSSMNKLSKPIPSLSSIPESETSPQHSSAPNLQFRLNVAEKITESSTTNSPEGPSVTQDISEPLYEEARMDLGSPSSAKSSLPNLSTDGLCHDSGDSAECIFIKQRHFSETDINFSPFKFPTSNC